MYIGLFSINKRDLGKMQDKRKDSNLRYKKECDRIISHVVFHIIPPFKHFCIFLTLNIIVQKSNA